MADPAVPKLQAAAKGLVFVSERDAPFEAFEWDTADELTAAAVRERGGHPNRAKVTESDFAEFFAGLTKEEDWFGDEEREQAQKYQHLLAVFNAEVSSPQVFCVGKTRVTYYLVGARRPGTGWA